MSSDVQVQVKKPRKRGVRHAAHPEKPVRTRLPVQDHVGAPFWALGTQVEYMRSFLDEWKDTKSRSKERAFVVKKVAILFIYKYGWDWADGDKPDANDPDPEDLEMADLAIAGEGDVKAERVQMLKDITLVSFCVLRSNWKEIYAVIVIHQRIGVWLRHHSTKVVRPATTNPLEPQRIMKEALLPPRKPRFDFVYASLFYEEKIKPVFDCSQEWLDLVGIHTPPLLLRNAITRELYRHETKEVIDLVELTVKNQYAALCASFEEYEEAEPTNEELSE